MGNTLAVWGACGADAAKQIPNSVFRILPFVLEAKILSGLLLGLKGSKIVSSFIEEKRHEGNFQKPGMLTRRWLHFAILTE